MANDSSTFIEKYLIQKLVENFKNEKLLQFKSEHSASLDGFMSELFTIDLTTIANETKKETNHHFIVKFMKGEELFRVTSKSYIQFPNEILFYSKILPYYDQMVSKTNSSFNVKDWVPEISMAKFGLIKGLGNSKSKESILVMKNLKPSGYRCGPNLYLNRQHLFMMIKPIAELHSFTYALKIKKDPNIENLIKEIIPLHFSNCQIGDEPFSKKQKLSNSDDNLFRVLYRVAFDRLYAYIDQIKPEQDKEENQDFFKELNLLREKYFDNPQNILEYIRLAAVNDPDDVFPAILHGDYNRNNVLFQYDSEENFDNPKDIKMIDFQELRYSTTAIDLSFFMYMNMDPKDRESDFWMELLHKYHEILISSMSSILGVDINDDSLKSYRFDAFYKHFTKYAFYGVMICFHYLPWKVSNPDELEKLATLFAKDMQGDEFRKISLECAGNLPDQLNIDIAKHAHRMGYIKNLL